MGLYWHLYLGGVRWCRVSFEMIQIRGRFKAGVYIVLHIFICSPFPSTLFLSLTAFTLLGFSVPSCLSACFRCFWAYEFGHQTSSTVVISHSKLKQHPAYEFGHQTSSTVVSSHSKLEQHPAYESGHKSRSTIFSSFIF